MNKILCFYPWLFLPPLSLCVGLSSEDMVVYGGVFWTLMHLAFVVLWVGNAFLPFYVLWEGME